MQLISCPVCSKAVSSDAPACPGCGHPIAAKATPKTVIITRGTGALGVLLVLLMLLGGLAAFTKPNESELRSELERKYGLVYGAGVVADVLGLVQLNYNDYVVFSTMSIKTDFSSEQTVATGIFGRILLSDSTWVTRRRSVTAPPATTGSTYSQPSISLTEPVAAPSVQPVETRPVNRPEPARVYSAANTQTVPEYTPEQMMQGVATARQTLLGDMSIAARNVMNNRHPLSSIEHCEQPTINSYDQSMYGEGITAAYPCRMRGTVTGENVFHIVVRVHAEIRFDNGTFVRRIKSTDVPVDNRN
jgi:hypothetical protein